MYNIWGPGPAWLAGSAGMLRCAQQPIVNWPRAAIVEPHTIARLDEIMACLRAVNGDRYDAVHVYRHHFAGFADAIAIFVVPERKPVELYAGQHAVAIDVACAQCVEAQNVGAGIHDTAPQRIGDKPS